MYYAHFGLKEPPFKITPNTDFFFSGGNRGAVLEALSYAILHGEGIVKVVGEVGSGKTMLCRMLQTQLPDHVDNVYLANPSMAPEDVLHAIALELRLDLPSDLSRLEVMQRLQQALLEKHAAKRQVVVFVEEAQGMPLATLEEIRLLTNLETRHDKLLQIVLFGQPELDENLNRREIRQLKERITHSFYLGPLNQDEIEEYLMFRLRAAGYYGPPLFSKRAIKQLAEKAQGLVRRVNILADKSLLAAFAANTYQVTPRHVRAAIRDSEFASDRPSSQKRSSVVPWILLTAVAVLGAFVAWNERVLVPHTTPVEPVVQSAEAPVELEQESKPVPVASIRQLIKQREEHTAAWLATLPSHYLTIELVRHLAWDDLEKQLQPVLAQLVLDDLYAVDTKVNADGSVIILYGAYENRQDALAELKLLPEELQAGAHLRTIAGIMEEMKQHQ
ncbi:AAA family ATPase [Methylobacillus arboreus]|uniref:ExeA family protein n=1 Tax=Methylobacillus arboreus TaxID=755170 RepID=UPI001E4AB4B6|nr:AAA family ATPase [Methylobacillus arboreus]MCB5190077.1 AAA family ATPase [Methylobacillus arboreus]